MRTSGALNALGVRYAAMDILPDPRIRQELSALSGWPTIPQLFVNGELVGGCDIVIEMYENGELAELLGVEQPDEDDVPAGARGRRAAERAARRSRTARLRASPRLLEDLRRQRRRLRRWSSCFWLRSASSRTRLRYFSFSSSGSDCQRS